MKTEQLIVQYLYNHKKVTLQDIGVFTITSEIIIPEDSDKDIVLPADTIQFAYDPKAPVDDGLVAFIMENTRKIKPLAYSDLESFIILNKQFLNIGKPLVFEGMGTLQKTQAGDYAFTQAATSHVTTEEIPKIITEKLKEKISFATPQKEKNVSDNKNLSWAVLALVIILGTIAAIYFYNKNTNDKRTVLAAENTIIDTLPTIKKDSVVNQKTLLIPVKKTINDSTIFYVVIREYTNLVAAVKSLNRYNSFGFRVILTTKDSVNYKLRMPFMKQLNDTLRVKDSLSKFFKAKAYIELP